MNDVLNVMLNGESANADKKEEATRVIERKLDPKLIKQRDAGGGRKLDYISGATVIRLLNKAFNYQWSFEIINETLVKSEPKYNKHKKTYEEQRPYIKVLGRLTVPGYGVKEQYGTKIVMGGATEQEGAAKSAATDALKKCATLLGIGLELYEDETIGSEETEQPIIEQPPVEQVASPQQESIQEEPSPDEEQIGGQWDDGSIKQLRSQIDELKELRTKLGIRDENFDDLNPFVQEFLNNPKAGYRAIGPKNIVEFNAYLQNKVKASF